MCCYYLDMSTTNSSVATAAAAIISVVLVVSIIIIIFVVLLVIIIRWDTVNLQGCKDYFKLFIRKKKNSSAFAVHYLKEGPKVDQIDNDETYYASS